MPQRTIAPADDEDTAHMFRCWDVQGAPGYEVRRSVDSINRRMAAGGGVLALLTILGPVVLAWWLASRFPAPQQPTRADAPSSLIPSASAQTKGTP
jgi:hypothetical protein